MAGVNLCLVTPIQSKKLTAHNVHKYNGLNLVKFIFMVRFLQHFCRNALKKEILMNSSVSIQRYAGIFTVLLGSSFVLPGMQVHAGGGPIAHDIDFEFNSLTISGSAFMPLGTDYQLVETGIEFSMSVGTAGTGNTIIMEDGDGDLVLEGGENSFVDSFFDVLFDITLADIDAGNDFANSQSVLSYNNISFNMGDNPFVPQCAIVADGLAFGGCGMLMAVNSSGDDYDLQGGPMVIDLGFDINADLANDALTIDSFELLFNGAQTTSIVGGTTTQTYDVSALLMGSINPSVNIDLSNGSAEVFTLANPGAVIPVPAAVWLFGSGLIGIVGFARRKAHK